MTAYNDLRFLDQAVDSILQQEFRDLELIIVDDGTGQHAIFEALASRDQRIRIVVNPTNLGTAAAANRGIEAARADIITRLDADDIAEPTQVGRLVSALADDPGLGLIGSAVTLIDEGGKPLKLQPMPETDTEIRWTILFHNPFYHSTVAFRRHLFEAAGRYRAAERISQDHYLWFDMLPHCRARNLAQALVRYRVNPRGLTAANMTNWRSRTQPIREASWARLGLRYDLYDDALAQAVSEFLRGAEIAPEQRGAAYLTLLTVLRAFMAAPQPHARPGDAIVRRQLWRSIVARALADPPTDWRDLLGIARLSWRLEPRAGMNAIATRLKRGLKVG
jgi:glycosyltransferase involved in cell wall biosynthesis